MSDIFLSYSSQDRERAYLLATALESQGWSVFWDRAIPTGKTWHDVLGYELDACSCVVVIWSAASIRSPWVYEEAEEGKRKNALFPTTFDEVMPPLGFRMLQAADLINWQGDQELPAFQQLVNDISSHFRLLELKATEADKRIEEQRKTAEAAKRAEEQRKAAEEAKRAEEQRKAAEEAKRAEEQLKAAEKAKRAEEQRKAAEEAKRAELERKSAEEAARLAEQQRLATKHAAEARLAAQAAKQAEEQRQAAEQAAQQAEERRKVAEQATKRAEEQRRAAETARKAEEERQAAEAARRAEEQRLAIEAAKKAEKQRKSAEAELRAAEEARIAEEKRKAEDATRRAAEERKAAEKAARQAEKRRKAAEEAARQAKAEQKAAEEARIAEEQRRAAEEAHIAEEQRRTAEQAAKLAQEEYKAIEAAKVAEEQRKAAEQAAKLAQEERKNAEEATKRAQQEQKATEAARIAKEKRKAAEEAAKRIQEERKAIETARIAEEKRKAAEEAAKRAEQERKAAEEAAKQARKEQKLAEKARLAEEQRKTAEKEAERNEQKRRAAEVNRLAEEKRRASEEARLAEEKRKAAEEAAKRAEAKRKTAEAATKRAEAERKAAEAALLADTGGSSLINKLDKVSLQKANYDIKDKIGEGGMATVYLAVHKLLDREVAVKVMSPQTEISETFQRSFINEARIVAKLEHPNIVRIYDGGVDNGLFYMAMELLPGGTLRKRLDHKNLTQAEALTITRQMASALSYAHGQGYIHRDIKPANILFRANGEAALADFGIAKLQGISSEMTQLGLVTGTPYYMSPEQAMGQSIDHRSDIYSLGIVFYEMLASKRPFGGQTPMAISYQHIYADIPRLDGEAAQFQPIIDRMLAKKPENRLGSADELLQLLQDPTRLPLKKGKAAKPKQCSPAPKDADQPDSLTISRRPSISASSSTTSHASFMRPKSLVVLLALICIGSGGIYVYYKYMQDIKAQQLSEKQSVLEKQNQEKINRHLEFAEIREEKHRIFDHRGWSEGCRKFLEDIDGPYDGNDSAEWHYQQIILFDKNHKEAQQQLTKLENRKQLEFSDCDAYKRSPDDADPLQGLFEE